MAGGEAEIKLSLLVIFWYGDVLKVDCCFGGGGSTPRKGGNILSR